MRDHSVRPAQTDARHAVQRAAPQVTASRGILGLQQTIGNRAVQRLLATPNSVQRVKTIDDDVEITGNLKASTVMSYNNAHVWGDFYVTGDKGTVIANNVPNSAVPVNNAQEPYNPSDI